METYRKPMENHRNSIENHRKPLETYGKHAAMVSHGEGVPDPPPRALPPSLFERLLRLRVASPEPNPSLASITESQTRGQPQG